MFARSRTGGGPPSGTSPAKNRLTENVEHGGEATMAAYTPAEQRSSRREYTESRRRKDDMPSGHWNGPEKRRSTVREASAGFGESGTREGIVSVSRVVDPRMGAGGSPGG
eukprot:6202467-Pleurochrysis_carterae.AAC.2